MQLAFLQSQTVQNTGRIVMEGLGAGSHKMSTRKMSLASELSQRCSTCKERHQVDLSVQCTLMTCWCKFESRNMHVDAGKTHDQQVQRRRPPCDTSLRYHGCEVSQCIDAHSSARYLDRSLVIRSGGKDTRQALAWGMNIFAAPRRVGLEARCDSHCARHLSTLEAPCR